MNSQSTSASASPDSAASLSAIPTMLLTANNQHILDERSDQMLGSPAWRGRKRAEAHGLLALSQIAPRLRVRQLDMRTELLTMVELLDTPVACMAPGADDIHIETGTLLAIVYPEDLITRPIPGPQPIRILEPRNPFHTNVSYGSRAPALCLGANIPRGFPLREMVLSAYAALTLQSISLDVRDPAGILNPQAAEWWQANRDRMPLTRESFLASRSATTPMTPTDTPESLS